MDHDKACEIITMFSYGLNDYMMIHNLTKEERKIFHTVREHLFPRFISRSEYEQSTDLENTKLICKECFEWIPPW